jgi:hypothetical protein
MRKGWIAAAMLLCSTSLCQGQEKSFVAVHGFDKMSCEDWLGSDGNADVRQQYIAWIRGVVTGYNYANPGDQVGASRMPTDFGLTIFVDNYCRSQGATSVSGAAFALIAERRGSSVVRVFDDQVKPDAKIADKAEVKAGVRPETVAGAKPARDDESPGFHEWLARQSDDIKSLGADIQRNIYKREVALQRQ